VATVEVSYVLVLQHYISTTSVTVIIIICIVIIVLIIIVIIFPMFICPIAIAYSMGQIIKSVCVCQSVCQCICPSVGTLAVAFLDRFLPKIGTDVRTPTGKRVH